MSESAASYAKALFQLSPKNKREEWDVFLKEFLSLLKQAPKVELYLKNPEIPLEEKKKVLQKWTPDPLLLNFLLLLLDKGKFSILPAIVAKFHERTSQSLGIQEGEIITAKPLDPGVKHEIERKLEKTLSLASVKLVEKIDPTILGGVILILGNKILDYSIQGRLKRMKRTLLHET